MGSGLSRLLRTSCLRPAGGADLGFAASEPLDETLGHSFCYVSAGAHSPSHSSRFRSISGASVSANSATPRTVLLLPGHDDPDHLLPHLADFSSSSSSKPFESTSSFGVVPLLPVPPASGPLDRSSAAGFFLSGPIERGALSGPLDLDSSSAPAASSIPFSAPLGTGAVDPHLLKKRRRHRRTFSRKSLYRSFSVVPIRNFAGGGRKDQQHHPETVAATKASDAAEFGENVQWAHGKAGEDRVHVVVSEDHRWLFVGIYDGFNGPDAPEFLMGNLYRSVFNELQGLFWYDESTTKNAASASLLTQNDEDPRQTSQIVAHVDNGGLPECDRDSVKRVTFQSDQKDCKRGKTLWELLAEAAEEDEGLDLSGSKRFAFSINCIHMPPKRRTPSFPNFRYTPSRVKERESLEENKERLGQSFRKNKAGPIDHDAVLRALSRGLESTEVAYLEMTDKFIDRNPELALMGSCLLVVLMRDEDVYVMNVGDSRAIVAQYQPHEIDSAVEVEKCGKGASDVEGIVETMDCPDQTVRLAALQLSTDHSTSIEEEVLRIKHEHPDDSQCIVNDRVKGRLKVTRAFGAGFLKQPKWNNVLLEMFRNDYIGTAPYISCSPSLCHHKLGPNDQFLILSSDGLYQYLTNQEAVSYVENFMERFPDGDPAQYLIEELLIRAAKKAGMDFHELLDIPQGDRRKYHDDVTVMVISLEGRIWKSSGKYLGSAPEC